MNNNNRMLPIGNLVHLKLGFKNIGDEEISDIGTVIWCICYPQGSMQYRKWKLNIPNLEIDQTKWTKPEWLFMPEVPGQHTMIVLRPGWLFEQIDSKMVFIRDRNSEIPKEIEDLKYALPYGLIGREYARTDDVWKASFYILNRGEYITITIILATVVLALGSFLAFLLQWVIQSTPFQIIFNF